MARRQIASTARVGNWIEARGLHGQPSRRGEIIEPLGSTGHEHYRVPWGEQHESVVYSTDGVIVTAQAMAGAREPTSVTR
jgi:Domain of unknown function (DUF1918)